MAAITTSNEDLVTRDTIGKFNHLAPEGYTFAKKKMTEKATARLRGYWLQTVSYNEKKQEMAADTERKDYGFNIEWLVRYQNGQHNCFAYLRDNGFLKIDKQPKKN